MSKCFQTIFQLQVNLLNNLSLRSQRTPRKAHSLRSQRYDLKEYLPLSFKPSLTNLPSTPNYLFTCTSVFVLSPILASSCQAFLHLSFSLKQSRNMPRQSLKGKYLMLSKQNKSKLKTNASLGYKKRNGVRNDGNDHHDSSGSISRQQASKEM